MTHNPIHSKTASPFTTLVTHCNFHPFILAAILLTASAIIMLPMHGLLGTTPVLAAENQSPRAEINKPAPDFTLTDLSGKTHSLHDYKGKIIILEWFNPDCPFVKASHTKGPLKTQGNQISKKKDTVWIAINSGAPGKQGAGLEHNQRMKKKYNMQYPIFLDESGEVGRLYGARKTPHMFIIDKQGILRYMGAIDNDPFAEKTSKGEKTINFVNLALQAIENGSEVATTETRPYGCTVKYSRKPAEQGG